MTLDDLLTDLVVKYGQKVLAEKIGIDDSTLSRARSGQAGLSTQTWQKILSVGEIVLIRGEEWDQMQDALVVMSRLYIKARGGR